MKTKKRPLLSIVIPTHNRSKYAISSIKSILDIDNDQIEVVVHDTSNDDRQLEKWIKDNKDKRIKYVHWGEHLSMTDNHEYAVSLAEGEYVCLIGDDDSVSSSIINLVEMCIKEQIDLLTPTFKATYSWPDFKTKHYGGAHGGKVYIGKYDCDIKKYDVKERLELTLSKACQGTDYLPKLYHGLVKNTLLDAMREKHGKIFFGASPDISASIGLSLISEYYYIIDFPFTLPGASGGSNTGRSAMKEHKGSIEEESHLKPYKDLTWPEWLPHFFSVETLWAQAAWDTLNSTGNESLLMKYNYARLYSLCFFSHKDYHQQIKKSLQFARSKGFPDIKRTNIFIEFIRVVLGRIIRALRRLMNPGPSNGRKIISSLDDVRMAKLALDKCLALNICEYNRTQLRR